MNGYAASAEAMQASSLDEVLEVKSSMSVFSPTFDLPVDQEAKIMQQDPDAPDFAARIREAAPGTEISDEDAEKIRTVGDVARALEAQLRASGRLA